MSADVLDIAHMEYADGTCTDECVETHPDHASSRGEDFDEGHVGGTYVVAYGSAFFLAYDGRLLAAPLDADGVIMWAGQDEADHPAIASLLATLPPNA